MHFLQCFCTWLLYHKAVSILSLCVFLLRIYLTLFIPDRRSEPTVGKYFAYKISIIVVRVHNVHGQEIYTPWRCFYFHTTAAHRCKKGESVQFRQLSCSVPQRCFAVAPLWSDRECWRSRVVCYVVSIQARISAATIFRNGSKWVLNNNYILLL